METALFKILQKTRTFGKFTFVI